MRECEYSAVSCENSGWHRLRRSSKENIATCFFTCVTQTRAINPQPFKDSSAGRYLALFFLLGVSARRVARVRVHCLLGREYIQWRSSSQVYLEGSSEARHGYWNLGLSLVSGVFAPHAKSLPQIGSSCLSVVCVGHTAHTLVDSFFG